MNERIEKLAEQCGFRSNPDIYDRNQSFDIGKFAALIVMECAKRSEELGQPEIGLGILKHFGVEE
jgi:hypothetical protein